MLHSPERGTIAPTIPSAPAAPGPARAAELDALLEALPVGVYYADDGGLRCNAAALRTFGVASAAELGASPAEFLRLFPMRHLGSGAPVALDELPMVRALAGREASLDLWMRRPDGGELLVRVRAAPVRRDGRIIGSVAISSDLTDQHALQQALRATAEEARGRAAELQLVLDCVPGMVLLARDAEGRVVEGNRFSYALLRRAPGENLSLNGPAAQAPAYRFLRDGRPLPSAELPVRVAARGERVQARELDLQFADGEVRHLVGNAAPLAGPDGAPRGAVGVFLDVTDRTLAVRELEWSRRALRLLASANETVARATSEAALVRDICRLAVEREGFRMAWIGRAEPDGARRILPVAHAGHDAGYLDELALTWNDGPGGRGPAGVAVRTGRPVLVNDVATDPSFAPWRELALGRGYGAALALPLVAGGARLGVLGLLAGAPGAFDAGAVRVLERLADDVAAGLDALRRREEAAKLATQLEIAVDVAGLGLWRLDLATGAATASQRARELGGFAAGERADRVDDWLGRVHEADREAVGRRLRAAIAGDAQAVAGPWSFRLVAPGGAVRWLDGRVTVERDGERPAALLGAVLDVTDRVLERERLQALSDRLQAAREEEKARVARDLHDDLGQSLTGLQLDLQAIQEALETLPPSPAIGALLDRAVQAAETARGTAAAVQRIALELRPVALDRVGLAAALRQELRRFEQRTGLTCRARLAELPALDPGAATALYRIGQEAFTNVARHAQARTVVVRLAQEGSEAVLEVEDDGRGLPAGAAEDPAALGLLSMRERARAAGGALELGPGAAGGTRVTARLPARQDGGAP